MTPNIVEIGECCAGVPARLADLLGTLHIMFGPSRFPAARQTVQLGESRQFEIINRAKYLREFLAAVEPFDVLHFYYRTLAPQFVDLPFLRSLGKEIWISFHGSDIRGKRLKAVNPFLHLADRIFVSTPDLLADLPGAEWLPNPVPAIVPEPLPENDRPLVVHCPSNPEIKGTREIETAVRLLRAGGVEFDYLRVQSQRPDAVLDTMRRADIVIDQVKIGMYGMVAVEAMALGRPVLAYLNEAVERYRQTSCTTPALSLLRRTPYLSGCPIWNCGTKPGKIGTALLDHIENPHLIEEQARRGPEYVQRVHGADAVRRILLS